VHEGHLLRPAARVLLLLLLPPVLPGVLLLLDLERLCTVHAGNAAAAQCDLQELAVLLLLLLLLGPAGLLAVLLLLLPGVRLPIELACPAGAPQTAQG
jgi:hypothetical protein